MRALIPCHLYNTPSPGHLWLHWARLRKPYQSSKSLFSAIRVSLPSCQCMMNASVAHIALKWITEYTVIFTRILVVPFARKLKISLHKSIGIDSQWIRSFVLKSKYLHLCMIWKCPLSWLTNKLLTPPSRKSLMKKTTGNPKISASIATNSVVSKSLLAMLLLIKIADVIETNPSKCNCVDQYNGTIFIGCILTELIDLPVPILMNIFNSIGLFLSEKEDSDCILFKSLAVRRRRNGL